MFRPLEREIVSALIECGGDVMSDVRALRWEYTPAPVSCSLAAIHRVRGRARLRASEPRGIALVATTAHAHTWAQFSGGCGGGWGW